MRFILSLLFLEILLSQYNIAEKKYDESMILPTFTDLEDARNHALKEQKPLLIFFTAYASISNLEAVWIPFRDEKLISYLNEKIVFVTLYCDDRTEIGEFDSSLFRQNEKPINTIGQFNSAFQIAYFQTNTQPYYILTDTEFHPIASGLEFLGSKPKKDTLYNWLVEKLK